MPFTTRNGARLHWEAQGSGTPVLLVMGHRYSSALWYPILPALAAKHRVISFDNRGTGESDTTRGMTIADYADDAIAVMDAAGVARAHIFGVSMGGVIVQDLAMRHPERVVSLLVGCSGILSADKPRMPAIMRTLYYLPSLVLKILLSSRRSDQGYGSAAPKDAIARDQAVLATDKCTVPGAIAQAKAIAGYNTTKQAVARLTMPSLVLHGDEDLAVPFKWGEELAATLPSSRFVKFAGAGHNFLVADQKKAVAEILGFLESADR
jgi:pimeloyl-ACP methyl ester carboxylesterase